MIFLTLEYRNNGQVWSPEICCLWNRKNLLINNHKKMIFETNPSTQNFFLWENQMQITFQNPRFSLSWNSIRNIHFGKPYYLRQRQSRHSGYYLNDLLRPELWENINHLDVLKNDKALFRATHSFRWLCSIFTKLLHLFWRTCLKGSAY